MKKSENLKSAALPVKGQLAMRGGSYSLIITAVVLAILIVINLFVSALPTNLTKYDISSSKLYSITSSTKVVLNALDQDVTIYWIVQADQEDDVIETLLGKYESLSDHITVVKRNPDIYPTFASQYTDETVTNNSLVVECGERSRFISYDEIYVYEADLYSYVYNTSFDGEGAITSAIDYVTTEDLPQVYLLEGHGEAELPSSFRDQIKKANMETVPLSLLTVEEIPEDASCILIHAPESDISEDEMIMLAEYVRGGGKLWVCAGPLEEGSLTNLYTILSEYGVSTQSGVVVDTDRSHYALQSPLILLPDMTTNEVTDPLMEENYFPIIPLAQGMTISETTGDHSVLQLLTTSGFSFSKATDGGYDISYEKEEGDPEGPFVLALTVKTDMDTRIAWFSSSLFLDDMYNAYSSGANADLAMNALSALVGEREVTGIRSKSLNYNYLTISESTSSLLKVAMIGVFPVLYLGIGIGVILMRKKVQHEAV